VIRRRANHPFSKTRQTVSVSPAAVTAGVPAQSRPANHADRRLNDDDSGRHDHASVHVAATIWTTMFAAAAAFSSLGAHAGEAQHGGEC
jgi:hypothetical protein